MYGRPDYYKRFVECLKSHLTLAAVYYDHKTESHYRHSLPHSSCLNLTFCTVVLTGWDDAVAMENDKT